MLRNDIRNHMKMAIMGCYIMQLGVLGGKAIKYNCVCPINVMTITVVSLLVTAQSPSHRTLSCMTQVSLQSGAIQ